MTNTKNLQRSEIECESEKALRSVDAFRAPVPVDAVAIRHGLTVLAAELGPNVSGVLVVEGERGSIGYNKSHALVRQRFTIAHELGHFLLHRHDSGTDNIFIDEKKTIFLRDSRSAEGAQLREIQANRFAACLLMPKELLIREVAQGVFDLADEGGLADLADKFGVSTQAMSIRLADLRLI